MPPCTMGGVDAVSALPVQVAKTIPWAEVGKSDNVSCTEQPLENRSAAASAPIRGFVLCSSFWHTIQAC